MRGRVAHCALAVNAGSRDERRGEFGLAHFAEHAFFKGTARRRAWQVNSRLENRGGELNAFTTKEDTTIHATVLRGDFAKAVELIADVAFDSAFPAAELEREREVILDEINSYKDSPAEQIFDTFEDMIFAGSELGHNILGTRGSLARFSGDSVRTFLARTHTTDQMVFSSVGSFSAEQVERVVKRYFGDMAASSRGFSRTAPVVVDPFERTMHKHTNQAHCLIGARAAGLSDERRLPLALLTNMLGGPAANSLLGTLLREKNGLSYNIEANYTPQSDCGLAAIYFSCDKGSLERCEELVDGVLRSLRQEPIPARRLATAKRQFVGQLAISLESNESYMLGVGKSLLAHGQVDTMEEVYRKIAALTAEDLLRAAMVFEKPSRLVYA